MIDIRLHYIGHLLMWLMNSGECIWGMYLLLYYVRFHDISGIELVETKEFNSKDDTLCPWYVVLTARYFQFLNT